MSGAYIILGPSGSGKDTQANYLAEALGDFLVVSTGELFRAEIRNRGELAGEVSGYVKEGKWVPDDLVFSLIQKYLEGLPEDKGVIFTGFPRTINQAHLLTSLLAQKNFLLKAVLHLKTSDESCLARITQRITEDREKGTVREDDLSDTAKERLRQYHQSVDPVIAEYDKCGLLITINNEQPIIAVQEEIKRKLGL